MIRIIKWPGRDINAHKIQTGEESGMERVSTCIHTNTLKCVENGPGFANSGLSTWDVWCWHFRAFWFSAAGKRWFSGRFVAPPWKISIFAWENGTSCAIQSIISHEMGKKISVKNKLLLSRWLLVVSVNGETTTTPPSTELEAARTKGEEWHWCRSIKGIFAFPIEDSSLFPILSSIRICIVCLCRPIGSGRERRETVREGCLWFWKMNFYLFACKVDRMRKGWGSTHCANVGHITKWNWKCKIFLLTLAAEMINDSSVLVSPLFAATFFRLSSSLCVVRKMLSLHLSATSVQTD